ncbi:hypothetical protein CANCADRAFT_56618 [Tortispora caseinolytica NRRL Y-17796]|uniref:Uncharacterized protein n=1 Tax=Tortispora caseinolytica NRRL Y-17796 TaxID=767744 RepID=A0A1E4TE00_9ASCO|nr:hypothetical protein CANCADRAFT_56618 [Tortispora caseinolytica NRRL Y-17796]
MQVMREGAKGAFYGTTMGVIGLGGMHLFWPPFKNITVPGKVFLFSVAFITGTVVLAEQELLREERRVGREEMLKSNDKLAYADRRFRKRAVGSDASS